MKLHRLMQPAAIAAVPGRIASGCSSQKVDAVSNIAPAVKVEQAPDPNLITADKPERFPLVVAVSRAEVNELIANGSVAPDVSRTVPVNALSSGRVVDVRVRLGDDVQQGQLLFTINSSDMSLAISDYQKFQADEALTKTQFDRAQLLFRHGALAQKDLDVAEETYRQGQGGYASGYGTHPHSGRRPAAPVVGDRGPRARRRHHRRTECDHRRRESSRSTIHRTCFTIADLSQVWVVCDVYENDLAQVHVGDRAADRIERLSRS